MVRYNSIIYVALIAVYAVVLWPTLVSADVGVGLKAYWNLDEEAAGGGCTGVVREDATSTNDLTDNNTTCSGTGIVDNAADFELSNVEYLSITDAAQSGLDITSQLTINAWIKLESNFTASTWGIACKMGSYPANRSYCFGISESSGYKFQAYIGDGSTQESDQVAWTPSLSTWYMVTMVADTVNGKLRFYVNGSLQGTEQTLSRTSIVNGNGIFALGSTAYSATGEYDGLIDEVGVWDRVLTADEITALYNAGESWPYPFTVEPEGEPMATTSITIGEIYSVFTLGAFGTIFIIAFLMTIFLNIGKATMNLVKP